MPMREWRGKNVPMRKWMKKGIQVYDNIIKKNNNNKKGSFLYIADILSIYPPHKADKFGIFFDKSLIFINTKADMKKRKSLILLWRIYIFFIRQSR